MCPCNFRKDNIVPKLSKVQKQNKLSDDKFFILTTHIVGLDLNFLSTKQNQNYITDFSYLQLNCDSEKGKKVYIYILDTHTPMPVKNICGK